MFNPWVEKIPWRRAWQVTPVFLPGESPRTEPGGLQSMGSQSWTQLSTQLTGLHMRKVPGNTKVIASGLLLKGGVAKLLFQEEKAVAEVIYVSR